MLDIFEKVQDSFMELGVVLSEISLEQELTPSEIEKVAFALKEAYKAFDEGLCEKAYMCEKCTQNGQELKKLLTKMQVCEKNRKMDRASNVALVEFVYIIPQVLAELRTVYLQSLKNRQV